MANTLNASSSVIYYTKDGTGGTDRYWPHGTGGSNTPPTDPSEGVLVSAVTVAYTGSSAANPGKVALYHANTNITSPWFHAVLNRPYASGSESGFLSVVFDKPVYVEGIFFDDTHLTTNIAICIYLA